MAAAIIAPLAVGGEETTAAARVPGSTGLPGSRSAERALEEAVATGTLNLSNRRLKQFPRGTASGYDLSDITQADLPEGKASYLQVPFIRSWRTGSLWVWGPATLSFNKLQPLLTDEFSELSFRISELTQEPRGLREQRENHIGDGDPEQIDFIDSSVPGEEEERGPIEEQQLAEQKIPEMQVEKPPSARLEEQAGEERRRPETLQLWQDRERRQQQQGGLWGLPRKESFLKMANKSSDGSVTCIASYNNPFKRSGPQFGAPEPNPSSLDPHQTACPATGPSFQPLGSFQKPNSFLFRSSSQSSSGPFSSEPILRPRRSHQSMDKEELMTQLRQVLESCLQQSLPEDLVDALANGVVLCQLANHLRPRSVPFIHVPSPAVPKLSALKARKNVESFLEACRKMGVPEVGSKMLWDPTGWGACCEGGREVHGGGGLGVLHEGNKRDGRSHEKACLYGEKLSLWVSACEGDLGGEGFAAADVCLSVLLPCPSDLPQADLCLPSDLLQGTTQGLRTTMEAVKCGGREGPLPLGLSPSLGGFALFYVVLMFLLYVTYAGLLGS
ncbi:leucine-rich repeat and calponin homology domain-containing protein 4 isoform X5 [Sarcophilus harrisii]|uniref:leucine-rich repeat and calponin homology domain-containing protein 4 isoform X5 n=1 Tax=Sarcophilus harrisii TaxID=9305 RepID=UPI001301B388|nr:leucine-rich repeat and calponin homology domain-containing protein 4 isoform X5 [Sarcophilus harrisii]